MRILQIVVLKLLSLAVLFSGAALVLTRFSSLYQTAIGVAPDSAVLRICAGALLTVLGLFGCLPAGIWRRKGKTISFPSAHGNVVIQLDSIEPSLSRAAGKMAEVKKIAVHVIPENNEKVRIVADAWLYTDPGAGARGTADRVNDFINEAAANILGTEVVTSVEINVVKLIPRKEGKIEPVAQRASEPEPALEPEPIDYDEEYGLPQQEIEPAEPSAADTEEEGLLPGRPLSWREPPTEDEEPQEPEPQTMPPEDLDEQEAPGADERDPAPS